MLFCTCVVSCCTCVALLLSRVASCCTRIVLCCLVLCRVMLVLCRVFYSCSFLDKITRINHLLHKSCLPKKLYRIVVLRNYENVTEKKTAIVSNFQLKKIGLGLQHSQNMAVPLFKYLASCNLMLKICILLQITKYLIFPLS